MTDHYYVPALLTAKHLKPDDSWTCECGTVHELGVYVAAHWRERLIHTCPKCGRKHVVESGTVTLISERKEAKHGKSNVR